LAIGGVSSPLDSFVVKVSSVLRVNFCAEKPAHRQSANRYAIPEHNTRSNKQPTLNNTIQKHWHNTVGTLNNKQLTNDKK